MSGPGSSRSASCASRRSIASALSGPSGSARTASNVAVRSSRLGSLVVILHHLLHGLVGCRLVGCGLGGGVLVATEVVLRAGLTVGALLGAGLRHGRRHL